MNVHKRCHKNVTNNCGINSKKFGEVLGELGISSESLSSSSSTTSNNKSHRKNRITLNEQSSPNKSSSSSLLSFNERSHTSPLPYTDQSFTDTFCNPMQAMSLVPNSKFVLSNQISLTFLI